MIRILNCPPAIHKRCRPATQTGIQSVGKNGRTITCLSYIRSWFAGRGLDRSLRAACNPEGRSRKEIFDVMNIWFGVQWWEIRGAAKDRLSFASPTFLPFLSHYKFMNILHFCVDVKTLDVSHSQASPVPLAFPLNGKPPLDDFHNHVSELILRHHHWFRYALSFKHDQT